MNGNFWLKRAAIAGALLALSIHGTAPAAVLAGDDEALVNVEEVCTDGSPQVKVKVVQAGDGHQVQWIGCPASRGFLGVTLTTLSPELRTHFGAPAESGVMVGSVVDDSPAQAAGLAVGDVITAIDGMAVASPTDVQRLIREREAGQETSIELVRDGRPVSVSATVAVKEMQEFDIGLLGDIGVLQKNSFFISSGLEGEDMVFKSVEGDVEVELDDELERLEDVFIRKIGDDDDLIWFDTETFNESMKEVHEYLASPEFQEKLKHLQERELELQERLGELELKLEKLERIHEEQ